MRRILAMVLLAALATASAALPARAQGNKAVTITADPVVLGVGEVGTWVATRHGDWSGGTLSIYVVGTIAEPAYSTLFGTTTCTEYHTRQSYRLECPASAEDMIVLRARLVIAGPYLHSVATAYDLADTYLADDWQIIDGTHKYYLTLVAH